MADFQAHDEGGPQNEEVQLQDVNVNNGGLFQVQITQDDDIDVDEGLDDSIGEEEEEDYVVEAQNEVETSFIDINNID